jgi:DnaJ-class molecular chaperone
VAMTRETEERVWKVCSECQGSGEVPHFDRAGKLVDWHECPACYGEGGHREKKEKKQ